MNYFACERNFYRIALTSVRDKKNKAIPAIRNFTLHPNDKGKLSVDCECFTSPEECIARIGATYKSDNSFKNHLDREIYAISGDFISKSELIKGIIYNPILVDPPKKGSPQNFSHCLLDLLLSDIDELEPEICLRLREHAKDRKVSYDDETTNSLIVIYRAAWN